MELPAPRKSHWLPTALKAVFVLFFVCLFGGAMLMIARGGADVSTAVGGPEAAALTAALRASSSTSFRNFQSQSETSCFFITLDDAKGTSVSVLLAGEGPTARVVAAGIARECDCPDDSEPCHLP